RCQREGVSGGAESDGRCPRKRGSAAGRRRGDSLDGAGGVEDKPPIPDPFPQCADDRKNACRLLRGKGRSTGYGGCKALTGNGGGWPVSPGSGREKSRPYNHRISRGGILAAQCTENCE